MKEKNISVRVRIRPEKERSNDVIKISKNKKAEINEENIKFKNDQFFFDEMYQVLYSRSKHISSYRSDGDYVQLPEGYLAPIPSSSFCDQGAIYFEIAQPMIDALWQHENSFLILNGPSQSGKRYTLLGTKENPGILKVIFGQIFDVVNQKRLQGLKTKVNFAAMQIHDEQIQNLTRHPVSWPSNGLPAHTYRYNIISFILTVCYSKTHRVLRPTRRKPVHRKRSHEISQCCD